MSGDVLGEPGLQVPSRSYVYEVSWQPEGERGARHRKRPHAANTYKTLSCVCYLVSFPSLYLTLELIIRAASGNTDLSVRSLSLMHI